MRPSMTKKTMSSNAPSARNGHESFEPQPSVEACETPNTMLNMPTVALSAPGTS